MNKIIVSKTEKGIKTIISEKEVSDEQMSKIYVLDWLKQQGKQISLDEKDIQEKALKAYYHEHNWSKEEQKRETVIDMAENSEFTQGYKQALLQVWNECEQSSASQPMSAEPTVQQLREVAKNNPDTFLAGALYVIDNYKLNSPSMSAEQVELLEASKIALHTLDCIEFTRDYGTASKRLESAISKFTAPTIKVEGWVSVEEKQRLEQIIELKEKERQEWANMCITKQKRIEELQAGYGDRLPDDYRYEEYGKEILKSISDTFLKNATKADRLSDAEVFQALGETILNFPLPSPPTVNIN